MTWEKKYQSSRCWEFSAPLMAPSQIFKYSHWHITGWPSQYSTAACTATMSATPITIMMMRFLLMDNDYRSWLKLHFDRFFFAGGYFKQIHFCKPEHIGQHTIGKTFNFNVQVAHVGVVKSAGCLDFIFSVSQFPL